MTLTILHSVNDFNVRHQPRNNNNNNNNVELASRVDVVGIRTRVIYSVVNYGCKFMAICWEKFRTTAIYFIFEDGNVCIRLESKNEVAGMTWPVWSADVTVRVIFKLKLQSGTDVTSACRVDDGHSLQDVEVGARQTCLTSLCIHSMSTLFSDSQ